MDKNRQRATEIHRDGTFVEFRDLLTKTCEENRTNPQNLEQALKTLIKSCGDILQKLQWQDRQKTEEQQLPEDGQQHAYFMESKGEDTKTSTLGVRERPSVEEVEGSKSGSKEIKVVDKVEDKVERANSSHVSYLEKELRECKRDLEAKEREIESLMRRVPHYNDMRTKQDQRYVEDTLSLNRQSRVEQDFKVFTSHERIDTCIMLQKEYKTKTDINAKRLSCMMFEIVYKYILATKKAMTEALKEIAKFAVENGPTIGHYCFEQKLAKRTGDWSVKVVIPLCGSGSEYPRDVVDGLLLAIKELAPEINTDIFLKDVKQEILRVAQELKQEWSSKFVKLLDAQLDDYLNACIKLTWRMVTQVPPLRLEYQTFTYKRDCHKIVESHDDVRDDKHQGQKVYYLWPGLVDGGGRTIVKGEVALEQ